MPEPLLGVFGGTFDPVHLGHLRLAEEAADFLGLTQVRWIPAGLPKHRKLPVTAAADRLQMVRLAIAGNERFVLDAAEIEADRPSYTVPTLERLHDELGGSAPALVLLLGADAYAGLPTWHRWQDLFALAHIAVAHRPGFPVDAAQLPPALADQHRRRCVTSPAALTAQTAGKVLTFPMTPLDISATRIRKLLAQELSPRYLLPEALIAYIQARHLYAPT